MNYEEAISFIHSTMWQGSRPGLSRITELLAKIGNPEKDLKVVHVAGTNGKGSFCSMLDSVLREAGYKTGLFTSPYIEFFEERIQYNGTPISKDELTEAVSEIKDACLSMADPPTEFEVLTALGFLYFKKKNVDIAVVECGMGGRLDSTNVIPDPVLSVITGISLDHIAFLGDTIEKIAGEKAGIIKEGRPVLYGGKSDGAKDVIKNKANELSSPYFKKNASALKNIKVSVKGSTFSYKKHKKLRLSLIGSYQPENAANVIEAVEILRNEGYDIPKKALYDGLKKARWKGRFERLCDCPEVYFDGGHNEEGVSAAVKSVKACFGKKRINVISGVLKDKDYEKIASEISSVANNVYTVAPDNGRALSAKEYAEVFKKNGINALPCESFDEAVSKAYARSVKDGRPLLCVGSLYSYPDFKKALNEVDKNGAVSSKAKEKRLAKKAIAWVLSLIAVFLALNILLESGILNGLFNKTPEYTEFPRVEDLYPADYDENIFEDEEYMEKERFIRYTENNTTVILETDADFTYKGAVAFFFRDYFDAVINGDHEAYNALLTEEYKAKKGEKQPFTMQKIYDIEVTDLALTSYLNEGTPNQITVYQFDVAYRIMENNGTYRDNLSSDDKRAMRYILYKYASGEILIFNMSEYYYAID